MPNNLRSRPHSSFGLRMTTTCISIPPFFGYHTISIQSGKCSKNRQIGQSGRVSTTTSAPLRVEMVMQSEPSAYSLLTPSG